MKKLLLILVVICISIFTSRCKKANKTNDIVYQSVHKEYVLIRDVNKLQNSNDPISAHVDSILSGLIQEEFVSTGQKTFDLNLDEMPDIGFEIIDLNKFNQNKIPASFDTLAARAIPITVEILDNSTYSYPDALTLDDPINDQGNWSSKTGVLGTFLNAGQFQGRGDRYLAFRFNENNNYNYGWIKLYCSQHSDTLRVIEFAYNKTSGNSILAGQKN
jgi:hypothetical protein